MSSAPCRRASAARKSPLSRVEIPQVVQCAGEIHGLRGPGLLLYLEGAAKQLLSLGEITGLVAEAAKVAEAGGVLGV